MRERRFILFSAGLPIRRNEQFLDGLGRIIRRNRDFKQVRSVHPFMHHDICVNGCAGSRLQNRLTDDYLGWSAALQDSCDTRDLKSQGSVPGVRDGKSSANGATKELFAQFEPLGVDLDLRHSAIAPIG